MPSPSAPLSQQTSDLMSGWPDEEMARSAMTFYLSWR